MKSIRQIVQALSTSDIDGVEKAFIRRNDKIAMLFSKLLNDETDDKIKDDLRVNANAYSTLRSRLRIKVQDHLIALPDMPKADVLKKLLSIEDIVFNQKPTIAVTTLKKLEVELIRYDLSNELTTIYKYLKKLHLNTNAYFHYSQLYNRHVAYSLALDKAEDILANYFKVYGLYYTMSDSSKVLELTALFEEMKNVCALYQSHRMFIYLASLQIFHTLFVDEKALVKYKLEPVEDILRQVEAIFKQYPEDRIYKHLDLLFLYIRFEYYLKHGIIAKTRLLLSELEPLSSDLLVHYENFTYPPQLLVGKLELYIQGHISVANFKNFDEFNHLDIDSCSKSARVIYFTYRALSCLYMKEYTEASKWLFTLNNEVSLKEHPVLSLELKCLTAYVKFLQQDSILFRQNLTSAQRALRIIGAENCPHLAIFVKMLGILLSESSTNKSAKLKQQVLLLNQFKLKGFQPILYINLQFEFLQKRIS